MKLIIEGDASDTPLTVHAIADLIEEGYTCGEEGKVLWDLEEI